MSTATLTSPVSVEQAEAVRFTPVRLREGYDMAEVDAYLDRVVDALRGNSTLAGDDVRGARFTPVRWREGYDMAEVDTFLDSVAVTLDQARPGLLTPTTATDPTAETTCGICWLQVLIVNEDGHRSWHLRQAS